MAHERMTLQQTFRPHGVHQRGDVPAGHARSEHLGGGRCSLGVFAVVDSRGGGIDQQPRRFQIHRRIRKIHRQP